MSCAPLKCSESGHVQGDLIDTKRGSISIQSQISHIDFIFISTLPDIIIKIFLQDYYGLARRVDLQN